MIDTPVTRREELTPAQMKFVERTYRSQVCRNKHRPPDRNGHKIEVKLTFDEWLAIWIASGKLHLRGTGGGKFCMARHNDLGDYEVGNVSIKSWEENSREAKLGKPGLKGRVSPTKGMKFEQSTKDKQSAAALALEKFPCEHCGAVHTKANLARYHGDKCTKAPDDVRKPRTAPKEFKFKQTNCPHCSFTGAGPSMTRYHFARCPHAPARV